MKESAKVLAISGGGVRGIYSAQAIGEIERAARRKSNDMFDLIAGTSVGGMLAIGLSLGISGKELAQQVLAHSEDIFGRPARVNPGGLFRSKHSPDRLRRAIVDILGKKNSNLRMSELPTPVLVPSISLTNNEITYFCGVDKIGERACIDARVIDALMATTAAPTFFPPHFIDGSAFVDGGVGVNSPDIDGLYYCRSIWFLPIEKIRLLSVGTGKFAVRRKSEIFESNFGGLSWIVGQKIISRMISLQECSATALAKDLLFERYCRIDTDLNQEIELDFFGKDVLEYLQNCGQKEVLQLLSQHQNKLAQFLY